MNYRNKERLMVVILVLAFSGASYFQWNRSQNDLQVARETVKARDASYQVLSARKGILDRVVKIDETVITRYQKSVDSCRNASQFLVDGDYYNALFEARDVGKTEEDVEPLLRERSNLLQGSNTDLL